MTKMIKQAFNDYKRKFPQLFLIEYSFYVVAFILLVYLRNKLSDYFSLIQEALPYLSVLQNGDTSQLSELAPLIEQVSTTTNQTIFIAIAIPITLLILFCISHGLIWKIISNIKPHKRYIFRFSLVNALGLILLSTITLFFIKEISFENAASSVIWPIIIGSIISHYLAIYSSVLRDNNIKEAVKNTWNILTHRPISFIYTLPLYIVHIITIFLFINLFLSYILNTPTMLSINVMVLYLAFSTLLSSFYRVYLSYYFSE